MKHDIDENGLLRYNVRILKIFFKSPLRLTTMFLLDGNQEVRYFSK